MRDIPIIFSAPMVRALLDGRKTQTRRLATSPLAKVQPSDRLWVRENFQLLSWGDYEVTRYQPCDVRYAATDTLADADREIRGYPWRPSIHMPRWASRVTLVVEQVRIMPLKSISEEDAKAEGIAPNPTQPGTWMDYPEGSSAAGLAHPRLSFRSLWESLHGAGSWSSNPLVIAPTFSVHRVNIGALLMETARVG